MADDASVRPRLLVLRPGAIGDTLVTVPALVALRRRYPEHDLLMAGNASALPILAAMGLVDVAWPFDDPSVTRLFMHRDPGPDDVFLGLATAIAWGSDPDGVLTAAFRRRGASDVVIAPSQPPASEPTHVARHLVETLGPLGVPGVMPDLPDLHLTSEVEQRADAVLAKSGLGESSTPSYTRVAARRRRTGPPGASPRRSTRCALGLAYRRCCW